MAKSVPAIFSLDRDGTINVDHGYVHEIDNFEFIDGVIDAMRELKRIGFALVVVTNQSGIARGKFTEAQFETLTDGWTGRWRTAMSIWMASIIARIIRRVVLKSFARSATAANHIRGCFVGTRLGLHIDMAASLYGGR